MTTIQRSETRTSPLTREQRIRAAFWVVRWERRGEPAVVTAHRAAELTPGWDGKPLVGRLGDHETTMRLSDVAVGLQQASPGYQAGGALLKAMGQARGPRPQRTWS